MAVVADPEVASARWAVPIGVARMKRADEIRSSGREKATNLTHIRSPLLRLKMVKQAHVNDGVKSHGRFKRENIRLQESDVRALSLTRQIGVAINDCDIREVNS